MYKLLEKALEHVRETFCGYISLFEKFLSFYEEIIDAQRFLLLSRLLDVFINRETRGSIVR